jgi:hypothetical protein
MKKIIIFYLLIALALILLQNCSSHLEDAKQYAATNKKTGAIFLTELAQICGKGYVVSHSHSEAIQGTQGWSVNSVFYIRQDAKVRSIVEATQTSRWHIARFMECMFVISDKEKLNTIQAKVTYTSLNDILNPLVVGEYSFDRKKLELTEAG